MATNPGVIVLTKTLLQDTQLHHRLDIEDNIGEEIHIHYKNFRMDYTVSDFLELARACDDALTNLQKYEKGGDDIIEIYIKDTGIIETKGVDIIPLKSQNNFKLSDNTLIKDYLIWKDSDRGLDLFIIPRHEPWIDSDIINNKNIVQNILDYTQSDNKIVEIFKLDKNLVVTKNYNNWYPFLIKSSNNWWGSEVFKTRQQAHYNRFKDKKIAKEFYQEIINEYKKFNKATGCYFSDVFPNNILVNEDYSDFRIIDVGCLKIGDTKIPSFSQVITGDAANNLGFINAKYLNEIW
tara:strand:- start:644 stop:1522 length:879 start_codon:yes stop_codon:yes gene_type:complete